MKKTVVCTLIAAMTMGSMVTPVFADGEGDATHVYVLTAPEDHGWTGSVATFAKEKIEEVNDAGTYSAEPVSYTHLDVYKRQVWILPLFIMWRFCLL